MGLVCCWFSPHAQRGFSPGTPVFLSPTNQHFKIPIRSGMHGRLSKFIGSPKCFVGKQITITNFTCLWWSFVKLQGLSENKFSSNSTHQWKTACLPEWIFRLVFSCSLTSQHYLNGPLKPCISPHIYPFSYVLYILSQKHKTYFSILKT